ncbi:hypothetical protein BHE74_00024715, partial [Ensete ventricosum]
MPWHTTRYVCWYQGLQYQAARFDLAVRTGVSRLSRYRYNTTEGGRKKKREKREKPRVYRSVARCAGVSRQPAGDFFSPRGEKERGVIVSA